MHLGVGDANRAQPGGLRCRGVRAARGRRAGGHEGENTARYREFERVDFLPDSFGAWRLSAAAGVRPACSLYRVVGRGVYTRAARHSFQEKEGQPKRTRTATWIHHFVSRIFAASTFSEVMSVVCFLIRGQILLYTQTALDGCALAPGPHTVPKCLDCPTADFPWRPMKINSC